MSSTRQGLKGWRWANTLAYLSSVYMITYNREGLKGFKMGKHSSLFVQCVSDVKYQGLKDWRWASTLAYLFSVYVITYIREGFKGCRCGNTLAYFSSVSVMSSNKD